MHLFLAGWHLELHDSLFPVGVHLPLAESHLVAKELDRGEPEPRFRHLQEYIMLSAAFEESSQLSTSVFLIMSKKQDIVKDDD